MEQLIQQQVIKQLAKELFTAWQRTGTLYEEFDRLVGYHQVLRMPYDQPAQFPENWLGELRSELDKLIDEAVSSSN